jgi:hypothetical protein
MSDTFDPGRAVKLSESLAACNRDLPDGDWEVWTSNSFRRVTGPDARDGGVLHAVVHRDGVADLSMSEENLRRLAWLRNNARSAAEMLRAAVAMIAGIREEHAEVLACADAHQSMLTQACRERDRLAARVAELEKLAGEACDELYAASRWIGSTQDRVDDATHKQFAAHITETAFEIRSRLGGK